MADEKETVNGDGDEFETGGDGEIEEADVDEVETGDEPDEDGTDEGDSEEPEERQVAQPRRQESRRDRAAREHRETIAQLQREVADLRGQRQQPTAPDPQAVERQEREFIESLRLMDPVDAAIAVRNRERQQLGQYIAGVEGRTMDRMDKQAFDSAARTDPAIKRLAPEVERYIAAARAQGNWSLERMTVFDAMYGRELRMKRQEALPRQQRQAQRRVASQTTRPTDARGDSQRTRRPADDSVEAARERLRGQPLW